MTRWIRIGLVIPALMTAVACGPVEEQQVDRGAALFMQLRCGECHRRADHKLGPSLHGIHGRPVELEDGSRLVRDDSYLEIAIRKPRQYIVKGYRKTMVAPDRVNDRDVRALIAYIKSLEGEEEKTRGEKEGAKDQGAGTR